MLIRKEKLVLIVHRQLSTFLPPSWFWQVVSTVHWDPLVERNCENTVPYPDLTRPRLAPGSFDPLGSSRILLFGRTSIPQSILPWFTRAIEHSASEIIPSHTLYPKHTFHALEEINGNVDSVWYIAPDLVRSVTVKVRFHWVRQSWKSFDKDWMQFHNWKTQT